jgi:hypothetical protein
MSRVPSTVAGGYFVGFTPDPTQVIVPGIKAKKLVRSWAVSASSALTVNSVLRIPPQQQWLAVDKNEETPADTYGTVAVVLDCPAPPDDRTYGLSLEVAWEVEVRGPTVEENDAATEFVLKGETVRTLYEAYGMYIHGKSAATDAETFWTGSHYGTIYYMEPSLVCKNYAGTAVARARYARVSSGSEEASPAEGFLTFYSSIYDARKAGANPTHTNGNNCQLTSAKLSKKTVFIELSA